MIVYAVIARGKVVLAEHTSHSGNHPTATRVLLAKISQLDAKMSYVYDRHVFHYVVENGITYLCMAAETTRRRVAFAFLEDAKIRFSSHYAEIMHKAPAFTMNADFAPILERQMHYYNQDDSDDLTKVKTQLDDVKNVMVENIEKVLERGEKIELLVDKTDRLNQQAFKFEKTSRQLRTAIFWRKLKTYAIAAAVMLFLVLVFATLACGGLHLPRCRRGGKKTPAAGKRWESVVRLRVATLNVGGRFGNAFEFHSKDVDWVSKYDDMLETYFEEGYEGRRWCELYPTLDTSLDLYVKRRSACRGGDLWFAGSPEEYLRAHADNTVFPPQATQASKRGIALLDMMCDSAIARAFASSDDFKNFEKKYPHVTRDSRAWARKLDLILRPLEEACDVIALQEAKLPPAADADDGALRLRGFATLLREDLVILYRGRGEEVVELHEHNFWDATTRTARTVAPPADDTFFETSTLPSASKRRAIEAMATTRRRTLGVDLGRVVVFAVHAKEHRDCADSLAAYFGDLAKTTAKPVVILSDTNLESPRDCGAFDAKLEDLGLDQGGPPFLTTFKERTVFQAQIRKASIPEPPRPLLDAPATLEDLYRADLDERRASSSSSTTEATPRHGTSRLVMAPKDRIVVANACTFVDRCVVPRDYARAATHSADLALRLPTASWPSDHIAPVANLLLNLDAAAAAGGGGGGGG
ncbi:hypothetical protein CTAYLR_009571, partial [Chrysophaeum taylorii]